MEIDLLKLLVGSFGGGGIAIAAAWLMFRAFRDAVEGRIDALEQHAHECANDRRELHKQLHDLETGLLRDAVVAIDKNTEVLVNVASAINDENDAAA